MSSGRVTGGGGIPAGSKKMVQSLKEIVSCSEAEIYAALKDCNMDPNEAVNRLLSQDTFQEVKRKKEKKKEGKDTTDFRARGANRSGKSSGADRYVGRSGSTPYYSSADSAPIHGRSTYKKENGSSAYTSSLSSATVMSGTNRGGGPPGLSDGASAENKGSVLGSTDGSSGTQPPSTYHSAWVGLPGQVSMADIVKMGRPQNKVTNAANTSQNKAQGPSTTVPQQFPVNEEWPSIEKPAVPKEVFVPESTVESIVHPEASGVPSDNVTHDSEDEEDQETDDDFENSGADDVESISDSTRMNANDDSREASTYENDLCKNMDSYQPQAHDFERHEDEEVGVSLTSVDRDLQRLRVDKDDDESPSGGHVPSVVIPDHLQVQSADCSHLSFGSFGSVMNVARSSGSISSVPAKTNLEENNREADVSSMGHPDTRNAEYYVDDSHRNVSDGNLFHRSGASAGAYDTSSALQSGELKPENAEVSHGDQYSFPSSNPGYSFDNAQQLNPPYSQTNSEMQNLAQFSNVMQSYPNSLPSALLAANVHPGSESEPQYSPFPVTQSMAAKYGNSVANIGGSTISMSEGQGMKTPNFTSTQPAQQNPPGANAATGPPLPQHLAFPYSQAALPLGHPYANMIGYPFLPPQSYTYMPSAFQQAFAGNNTYHQSLAAVLPQYKSSGSVSTMPQSASIASGFGAFGNNTTIPGSFSMNPPAAAPTGSTLSYDDVLSSQYKENNSHLMSLQQNENSAMWMHGANSRTMSAVPASTYYNYQAQQSQQQPGGFRQGQQPAQNYGTLGYPNFYHSQAGISLDQGQNQRDGSLGGSQGQPKQSQIWQNSY